MQRKGNNMEDDNSVQRHIKTFLADDGSIVAEPHEPAIVKVYPPIPINMPDNIPCLPSTKKTIWLRFTWALLYFLTCCAAGAILIIAIRKGGIK